MSDNESKGKNMLKNIFLKHSFFCMIFFALYISKSYLCKRIKALKPTYTPTSPSTMTRNLILTNRYFPYELSEI